MSIIFKIIKDTFLALLICSAFLTLKKNKESSFLMLAFLIIFFLLGIDVF